MTISDESNLLLNDHEGVTVVSFASPTALDAYHVPETARRLYDLVEKQRKKLLVLDFSQVRMISSQSLGVLLNLQHKLLPLQGRLAIAGLEPKLSRVFKITRLESMFPFCPDVPHAVAAVHKNIPSQEDPQ